MIYNYTLHTEEIVEVEVSIVQLKLSNLKF